MGTMSPKDFRRWRKAMNLSQKDAAEALGLKRRVVQYYEKGERDGEKVDIPKYVRLACYALMQGIKDYKGPAKEAGDEKEPAEEADGVGTDSSAAAKAGEDGGAGEKTEDTPRRSPRKTRKTAKAATGAEDPPVSDGGSGASA